MHYNGLQRWTNRRIALSSSDGRSCPVPLGTKLESREQIINMPITNTSIGESQIPASANHKYQRQQMINMPNYNKYQIINAPLLSIESSPMSTSMAVIEIDAQMYLSCICQIYLPYICQIYLSRGAKRGWSICFFPSTLLCCCFPSLHWRGTMAARLFQTVGCK